MSTSALCNYTSAQLLIEDEFIGQIHPIHIFEFTINPDDYLLSP